MLLLEHDITKKGSVSKTTFQLKFEANGKDEKYKVKEIWDSTIYAWELVGDYQPRLYYLVLWNGYFEEENTWEPVLTV